jgi:hypothetical protein
MKYSLRTVLSSVDQFVIFHSRLPWTVKSTMQLLVTFPDKCFINIIRTMWCSTVLLTTLSQDMKYHYARSTATATKHAPKFGRDAIFPSSVKLQLGHSTKIRNSIKYYGRPATDRIRYSCMSLQFYFGPQSWRSTFQGLPVWSWPYGWHYVITMYRFNPSYRTCGCNARCVSQNMNILTL